MKRHSETGVVGRLVAILCLMWLFAVPAWGQEAGLSFLRIGTNAGAMALGDAQVAHSRDAFSTYWNPAGLAAATSNIAALSHHIWIADVRTYAFAVRLRTGRSGSLGFFATGTGLGDLEARDRPGDPDGLFSVQFVSTGVAYGRRFGPVRLGATAKYLSERIYTNDANGYAFDFGMQLDAANDALQLGAAFQNVGKMSRLDVAATPLPRMVRAGIAVFPLRILAEDDNTRLLNTFFTGEVSHVLTDGLENPTRLHLGVAAEVMELVSLRVGYITNDELRSLTLGGGIEYGAFVVDYAYLPFQSGFEGPGHVLTLAYGW